MSSSIRSNSRNSGPIDNQPTYQQHQTGTVAWSAVHAITVFRIRDGVTDPDEIIDDRGSLWSHPVRVGRRLVGTLYVKAPKPRIPNWLSYFGEAVDFSELRLRTSSTAAVLLASVDDKLYAVTFGYGKYLLADGVTQRRFGLRATLNAIEPTQIRSIDHKRLDAVSRQTREQVSRASNLLSFGLDVERDLLKAVTGRPIDAALGVQLSGSDQLTALADASLQDLESQLRRFEALASRDDYRQTFPWVDNIAEVTSGPLRDSLAGALVTELKEGALTKVWMAIPEIIDWGNLEGFQYRSNVGAPVFRDLSINDYFDTVRSRAELGDEQLHRDRVYCANAEESDLSRSWTVHRCLLAELTLNGNTYILSEGKWYEVAAEFMAQVDAAIAALPASTIRLPKFAGNSETEYNSRAAAGSRGKLHLMDKTLIQCGGRSKIEPCDLYSDDRRMVHVKRYGGSSVLSHLFAQGTVAAQMLLHDKAFRMTFNERLPISHRIAEPELPPDPRQFEVAYVVAVGQTGKLDLPFFSRVNLRNASRLLRQLGFGVTLTPLASLTPSRS